MTKNADFKALVRERMTETGLNYTAARAELLARRATAPAAVASVAAVPDPAAARAEHERLICPFLRDGRLVTIPAKRRPRFAVLLELLARFAPGETYTEREVNEILGALHEDVAYLRRELVDYGLLERDSLGSYWVAAAVPPRVGNAAQEVTDWERVWLPQFLAQQTRPQQTLPQSAPDLRSSPR